jgi:hypothetical protein
MADEPRPTTTATKSACVIAGATPEQVAEIGVTDRIAVRKNALGTLVTGRPGDLVIDYAEAFSGPVYDVMYNAQTGWFSVTVYRGIDVTRWDNRPADEAGYPRVDAILGATTPMTILAVLDIPPDALGYTERLLL